ncbi:Fur family transcriptional regulator [Solidesulfovibrio magneticus]|uniref:Fur family transcriptional regulator n=1 Tax=Solidesulfovibrio magneticus (strain ATCC 700980 / DSM 13731 / RS-1) TaxID=573370 RepID=C4XHG0_SOLM1|nr:Fur family transcriptional regulator [Solidesulfovibrio magneticus]BAH73928.1 Fur family transcriptional regulator [Solidesulfovibrio magneticus RS-1]
MKPPRSQRLQAIIARLHEGGYRVTPQREAILAAMADSPDHPTAEVVHRRLLPYIPDLSLATVYKTLTALKACGEVLELQFSNQDNRYDAARPKPHPHLICQGCGTVTDSDLPGVEAMALALAEATGYAITSHRLDFFGLCPACRARGAAD